MKGNSRKKTQVKVCDVCGDKGFSNALIDCSNCPDTFAHQYCMGIPPGSVDSSFTWVCEDCCEPAECRHRNSMMSGDVSTKSSEEACDVSIDVTITKPKMKAVTPLYSESKGNKQKRKRDSLNPDGEPLSSFRSQYRVKRLKDQSLSTNKDCMGEDITTNMSAKVEAKSKSRLRPKVIGHANNNLKLRNEEKGQHSNDEIPIDPDNWKLVLLEEQPKPLVTLMPIEYEGSSEQAETSYGSLRTKPKFTGHLLHGNIEPWDSFSSVIDCPKEIMRGVVLLVSPLGEIYIECASLNDDQYPASLATAILCLTNSEKTEVLDELSLLYR